MGIIHEGKTTNLRAYRSQWGEPGTDRVPMAYQVQVQHQMLVTGIDEAIVSVLVFPISADEMEAANPTPDVPQMARGFGRHGAFLPIPKFPKMRQSRNCLSKSTRNFGSGCVEDRLRRLFADYNDLKLLIPEPSGELDAPDRLCELAGEHGQIAVELDILKNAAR